MLNRTRTPKKTKLGKRRQRAEVDKKVHGYLDIETGPSEMMVSVIKQGLDRHLKQRKAEKDLVLRGLKEPFTPETDIIGPYFTRDHAMHFGTVDQLGKLAKLVNQSAYKKSDILFNHRMAERAPWENGIVIDSMSDPHIHNRIFRSDSVFTAPVARTDLVKDITGDPDLEPGTVLALVEEAQRAQEENSARYRRDIERVLRLYPAEQEPWEKLAFAERPHRLPAPETAIVLG